MSYDMGINGSETNPETSVIETELASMQDDSYSFDESNVEDVEFLGEDDVVKELDFSVDQDRINEVTPESDLSI
ncbi:MAG TPA: hypothetical protein VNJ01_10810 [Bacteriovoracaceae bacterium]|nr:hypothetical protein [Bacteriovoracaceae bacterium]